MDKKRVGQIKEQFEALEKCGINYIHIDITDGHFVPMISFGANTVKDLRKHTDFVLDCHLMVENPENLIPVIADAGADIITVHTEAAIASTGCFEIPWIYTKNLRKRISL